MKRSIKNTLMIILIIFMTLLIWLTMNMVKTNNSNDFNNQNTQMQEPPSNEMNGKEPPAKPDNEESNSDKPSDLKEPPEKMDGSDFGENKISENKNSSNNNYIAYFFFGTFSLVIASTLIYLIMSNFNKKNFKETFTSKDKITISVLSIIILTGLLTYLSIFLNNKYYIGSNQNNFKPDNASNVSYSASLEITENKNIDNENLSGSNSDENVILINGEVNSTISNTTILKEGDSDGGDNTSFYGNNSAVLAKDGANVTLNNITITTSATGANGVFSYGGSAETNNTKSDGTTINISDSSITTTKDNSGGIMVTGGGIMNASNLNILTSGISSAAIRSDRGGGTINVTSGNYETTGQGSPAIYSTANITVNDATLKANSSEGIIIEGKNSVTINNSTLIDNNNKLNGQSTTYKNIFLYQSMSGDAAEGNASFSASNSKIITNKGDTFYITNTRAKIYLNNNEIINNDSEGNFLRIKKDSWGADGSNGGTLDLTLDNQKAIGNIVVDEISSLTMNITNNSYYEGSINLDNTAKELKLSLDSSSKIKLTSDSYITELNNTDLTNSNIDFNGYKLYINGKSIN